jgi:hypothetical protein
MRRLLVALLLVAVSVLSCAENPSCAGDVSIEVFYTDQGFDPDGTDPIPDGLLGGSPDLEIESHDITDWLLPGAEGYPPGRSWLVLDPEVAATIGIEADWSVFRLRIGEVDVTGWTVSITARSHEPPMLFLLTGADPDAIGLLLGDLEIDGVDMDVAARDIWLCQAGN